MIGKALHTTHLKYLKVYTQKLKRSVVIFADGNMYQAGDADDAKNDEILKNEIANKKILASQIEDFKYFAKFNPGDAIPATVEELRDLMIKQKMNDIAPAQSTAPKTSYTVNASDLDDDNEVKEVKHRKRG